jgi:hypothetical protein
VSIHVFLVVVGSAPRFHYLVLSVGGGLQFFESLWELVFGVFHESFYGV